MKCLKKQNQLQYKTNFNQNSFKAKIQSHKETVFFILNYFKY